MSIRGVLFSGMPPMVAEGSDRLKGEVIPPPRQPALDKFRPRSRHAAFSAELFCRENPRVIVVGKLDRMAVADSGAIHEFVDEKLAPKLTAYTGTPCR